MARSTFPSTTKKSEKRERGRTPIAQTPLAIRSRVELPEGFRDKVREQLGSKLGYAGTLIERGTVRFEDINGPRGGIDIVCRIKLVLSGQPSLQVDARGKGPREAFSRAVPKVVSRLVHTKDKQGLTVPGAVSEGAASPAQEEVRPAVPAALVPGAGKAAAGKAGAGKAAAGKAGAGKAAAGEIIGPRAGRGAGPRASALARPEKLRRDAYVDTADAGVSESDRKAGGNISARRNSRGATPRATVALEDSRAQPSRKSTRRSANRGKASQGKERSAVAKSITPRAKAARASVQRGRPR